jgi:hypothetical protein
LQRFHQKTAHIVVVFRQKYPSHVVPSESSFAPPSIRWTYVGHLPYMRVPQ